VADVPTNRISEKAWPEPSLPAVVWAVARVTAREILREKLLYNVVLVTFMLFGVGTLASRLTYTRPERIMLDFGVASVFFSCAAIAALVGASLLAREIDRRTIHVVLSHPVSQFQFACGKFAGLAAVILLNWLVLVPRFLVMLHLTGGAPTRTLAVALAFALLQGWMLGALALAFSSAFTTAISIIVTFGLYLIGTNVSQLRWLATKEQSALGRHALELLARLVPNFEHFNLGTRVTYALPVSAAEIATAIAYAFTWILISLLAAGILLKRKEI
jgi:ABC-type transport system involved in multi-copper enzyme maturation permease subunit